MEILKFHATWCQPCRLLAKKLEDMKPTCKELQDATIREIDIEDNDDLVQEYNIRSVPTLIIKDKNLTEPIRIVGLCSEEQLRHVFEMAARKSA